jgi:hypothetical protein
LTLYAILKKTAYRNYDLTSNSSAGPTWNDLLTTGRGAVHLITAKNNGFGVVYSNHTHLLSAAPHFGLQGLNVIAS